MKRPAFQFYPADWRKDVELRSCSVAARGLWIDMLCIAHECDPYGHLAVNGHGMTVAQIAGQVGLPVSQCARLLDELFRNGVARKTESGVIYNKRMVDDERIRNIRADAGRLGGNPNLLGDKVKQIDNLNDKQKPTPSSSSSSSNIKQIQKHARKARSVCLPENFGNPFSPAMQEWLDSRGENQVKAHLIHFIGYAKASGKRYVDWDQAFQNAVRDDWAGVRKAVA